MINNNNNIIYDLFINNTEKNLIKKQKEKTIKNCLTQKNKIIDKRIKMNNIIKKDHSLIINNLKDKKINKKEKKNNNIYNNLNNNYFKLFKYSNLLTLNKDNTNSSPKKNIELSLRSHSLSSKKRLLKIYDNYKTKGLKNNNIIYFSHRSCINNNNSSFPKMKNTIKKSYKKHRKVMSGNLSLKKRNNLIRNLKTQNNINKNIIVDLKKNLIFNNKRLLLRHQNNYKNLIEIFNNTSYNHINKKNLGSINNNTFKNIKKSINTNKLMINTNKRKCKSNTPNSANKSKKYLKINKKRIKLKSLNNIFIIPQKIKNEINDNNTSNNFNDSCRIIKSIKYKIFESKLNKINKNQNNTNSIKEVNPLMISLDCKKINHNLVNQSIINKNNNKYKNNYEGKLNIKRVKSPKFLKLNNKNKYIDNLNLNQTSKNKDFNKLNIITTYYKNKIKDKTNSNKKKLSTISLSFIQKKNIFNKKNIYNNNKKMTSNKNMTLKNLKNNYKSIINNDFPEYLTERRYDNKKNKYININNKQITYSKNIINNNNSYFSIKKINEIKKKFLICKNITDKSQNKENTKIRSYKTIKQKNSKHQKSFTNKTGI